MSRNEFDVARDSDVPISTQIYWQLAYQIDSGRLVAGSRLPTVRELGAALRVNPNTIRAVYQRLAEAGYITTRQGAGTHVADRSPQRRGSEALAGIVAEMLGRAAQAGFTADEVAATAYAAAAERRRPGPLVHVLFAECTTADARHFAGVLNGAFAGQAVVEGTLLPEIGERLTRFHYDLLATSAFHGDEAMGLVQGRLPVVAMLATPAYVELVQEVAELPDGAVVGLVCGSPSGAANMAQTLRTGGRHESIRLLEAVPTRQEALEAIDREADLVLLSREAQELGLAGRFGRPGRLRNWTYELDPSGLELLRRTIAGVQAERAPGAVATASD